jgi:hypothetical protein
MTTVRPEPVEGLRFDRHNTNELADKSCWINNLKLFCLLAATLGALPLHAEEAPNWHDDVLPDVQIKVVEPARNEVVVVINDNALGGNHAGLFAGKQLIDPAGSYFGRRGMDKAWPGPTLADYARFQTVDGLKIRLYRFLLKPGAFAEIERRVREAGSTPPLFCAVTVHNLLAGAMPFDAVERTGWTTPAALGRLLDGLTQGEAAIGECQNLDATPC